MKIWIAAVLAALLAQLAAAADSSSRAMYRCDTPEGIVFADRPCDAAAQPYRPELTGTSVIETVQPARTAAARSSTPVVRPRPAADAEARSKSDTCDRLQENLRKVNASLRAGYGARQGERLKERRRELERKRRAAHC